MTLVNMKVINIIADCFICMLIQMIFAAMLKGEKMSDSINRQAAIDVVRKCNIKEVTPAYMLIDKAEAMTELMMLPSVESEIADNLYLYKCYITDKDGLQHEVIHTGDIRRVTGWEI